MHNDNIITNKVEQTKGLPNSSQTRTTKCQTKKKIDKYNPHYFELDKGRGYGH